MHAEEVLLNVVGTVELLPADVAVEWFFVLVDVLVAREQVASVGSVWTVAAAVALLRVGSHVGVSLSVRYRGWLRI